MRPLFADPRTDFAFYRIFGTEEHKDVLLGFLNHVLELDEAHRIVEVHLLTAEQRPKVKEIKNSIVDVKCKDARGTIYVVEMQVAHVEAFEKRVVYNVAKAFVNQLGVGQDYPALNDVVGVTICEFELWPEDKVEGRADVEPLAYARAARGSDGPWAGTIGVFGAAEIQGG